MKPAISSRSFTPRCWLLAGCVLALALPRRAHAETATTVSAELDRTCAVTGSNGLRCWGAGLTGDGTNERHRLPVEVTSLAGSVASVDVGPAEGCVVTTSGGVLCWGGNDHGQAGNGSTSSSYVLAPTPVVGLASGVSAVAAGGSRACALLASGGVKCWGSNQFGALGDGTTTDSPVPVDVVGLGATATAIAARFASACVVTSAGGVKCWGVNVGSPTPVDLAGLTSGIAGVALGFDHTCVLTVAGGVKCFGQNDVGQLGDGTNTPSATPVDVVGLSSGVVAIDTSRSHTCALMSSGAMKCWGLNENGQLGDGTRIDRNAPVDVAGLAGGVVGIATGREHSCAAKNDGALLCWGNDFYGATGTGWWFAFESLPDNVVDFGPPVCAIVDPGQIFATRPAPRLVVKQGKFELGLALTASVEFALPPGVSFADLDPLSEGMRLQIRDQLGVVRVDARMHGGAYDPVLKLGWQRNRSGSAWTYRASGFTMPFGVSRVQFSDRARGAPGGHVRVTLRAKEGLYPVADANDPVEVTMILGDDASAAAGKCGKSAYLPGQCTENEPGTVLRCK